MIAATTARTRRRFPTPTTTRCAAATPSSKRPFPKSRARNSANRKVGAPPSEKFAKVRHAVPMLSLGNIFAEEEVQEFCARVRRFLGMAEDAALDVVAEPKIDGLSCNLALRERRTRSSGDARRRLRGRGRNRQCAHGPLDPEPARGRAERLRGAWRSLYAPRRFRRPQQPPGRGGQAAIRQSAQRRRRVAAPARPDDHRRAPARVFRLRLGRGQRAVRLDPARGDPRHATFRPADQPADQALPNQRRDARALPRHRGAAREPRLRHRRRGLQGRRSRPAAAARLRLARAALGGRAQVPGRAGDDGRGGDRDQCRPDRRADAGRAG